MEKQLDKTVSDQSNKGLKQVQHLYRQMNKFYSLLGASGFTFILFSTAIGIAFANATISISGTVTPSQGQEGDVVGTFSISGLATGAGGGFTGTASLSATGPGLGPTNQLTLNGSIQGRLMVQGTAAMVAFRGVSEDGQAFSGQFRGDLSTGVFIGFFNIPGNGFLSVIFVNGTGSID
ncbi:MAG: hypothetical protein HYU39_06655 [Thaumarchaeota archaeon]|nr:hypothetical protein [Nitrososphaerota archaeon]